MRSDMSARALRAVFCAARLKGGSIVAVVACRLHSVRLRLFAYTGLWSHVHVFPRPCWIVYQRARLPTHRRKGPQRTCRYDDRQIGHKFADAQCDIRALTPTILGDHRMCVISKRTGLSLNVRTRSCLWRLRVQNAHYPSILIAPMCVTAGFATSATETKTQELGDHVP